VPSDGGDGQDLALPVDVPWTLLATSPDMLASRGDAFPNAMCEIDYAIVRGTPVGGPPPAPGGPGRSSCVDAA
jgi:hypothetical protein